MIKRTVDEINDELLFHSAVLFFKITYLNVEEIITLFNELMCHHIYFDEFIDIIDFDTKLMTLIDFSAVLKSALTVMKTPFFNRKEHAKNHIIFYYLNRIINNPLEIINNVASLSDILSFDYCDPDNSDYGMVKGLCEIYHQHYSTHEYDYEVLENPHDIDQILKKELMDEAQRIAPLCLALKTSQT